MQEDEALKTMGLFEGASETGKISKSALKNWVVCQILTFNSFSDCIFKNFVQLFLNGNKTNTNPMKMHVIILEDT